MGFRELVDQARERVEKVQKNSFFFVSPFPGVSIVGERTARAATYRPWWQGMPEGMAQRTLENILSARSVAWYAAEGDPGIAGALASSVASVAGAIAAPK